MSERTLKKAIRDNRRNYKYERLLRRLRLRIFDYEDAGSLDKAQRVIGKCKKICGPRWNKRAKRREDEALHKIWNR